MEGRSIVREANLEQFKEHPDFAEKMNAPEAPSEQPMYPNPLDAGQEDGASSVGHGD